MELTEVVSLHVAAPVIAVIICAFFVFLFGFKSPAQPPSFDFDDDKKQRRQTKKTKKLSGSSNGHAIAVADSEEISGGKSAKQSVKSSSPKSPTGKTQPVVKKDSKKEKSPPKLVPSPKDEAAQDKPALKQEPVKKIKKVVQKETPKSKTSLENREDDGGWTTVQISKKDKKVKSKRDEKDMAEIVDKFDVVQDERKPASSGEEDKKQEKEVVQPQVSPQAQRQKKKKKPKVPETSIETTQNEPTGETSNEEAIAVIQPEEIEEEKPKVEEEQKFTEVMTSSKKKKKNNSESPEKQTANPNEIENQHINNERSQARIPVQVTDLAQSSSEKPARSSKSSEKTSTETTKSAKQIPAEPTMARSPKKSKNKSKSSLNIPENSIKKITDDVESSSNKTKGTHTKNTEITRSPPIDVDISSQKSIENNITISKNDTASKSDVEIKTADSPVTFDELGESWEEAKPKMKKKKVRREN